MVICDELQSGTTNRLLQDKLLALYLKYYKAVSDYNEGLVDDSWHTLLKSDIKTITGITLTYPTL